MNRKFIIINQKDLPDNAKIIGFTFLKKPGESNKDQYDFCCVSQGQEVGCMYAKRNCHAISKGYIQNDNNTNEYIEVKTRVPFWIFFLGIIVLLIGSCLYLAPHHSSIDKPGFSLTEDEYLQNGERVTKTQEEIQAELNAKVQEGMINISMNLNPVFKSGTEKGNLLIVNEEINHHPQVIEIYRKDTEELIYRSGLIPVGSRIEEAPLLVDLDAGRYPCVAYFHSVNENTGNLLGKAGAEIVVIIQS